jgi:predicted AlkP superfamily pyrophosphatase or phosphodiesterase
MTCVKFESLVAGRVKCLLLLLLLTVLQGCATLPEETGRVVIIGIDGMSPAGIRSADTPMMDGICQNGACTFEMRAVLPTKSSPNWASMITGAAPEQHGVTSNAWRRDKRMIKPLVTGQEDIFPTLFGLTRQQAPESVIGLAYEWKGLIRMVEASVLDLDVTGLDGPGTVDAAVAFMNAHRPELMFVHLDFVDHAGHAFGHGSPEYIAAVELADHLVGRLLRAADEAGVADSTTYLVSADHGLLGTGHGGESMDELLIPLLMTGRHVRSGVAVSNPVNVYDIAPTAALLLGVEMPEASIGRPVCGALEHPAGR